MIQSFPQNLWEINWEFPYLFLCTLYCTAQKHRHTHTHTRIVSVWNMKAILLLSLLNTSNDFRHKNAAAATEAEPSETMSETSLSRRQDESRILSNTHTHTKIMSTINSILSHIHPIIHLHLQSHCYMYIYITTLHSDWLMSNELLHDLLKYLKARHCRPQV